MSRQALFTIAVAVTLAAVPLLVGCGNNTDVVAQTDCPECEICPLVLEGCGPLPLQLPQVVQVVPGHDEAVAVDIMQMQLPPIVNMHLMGLPPDPFTDWWAQHLSLGWQLIQIDDYKYGLESVQAFLCDVILIAQFIEDQVDAVAAQAFLDAVLPLLPPLIAAVPPPPVINPPPPPPPAPTCDVELLVEDGGALRDPGQRAFTNPGELIRFQAVVTSGTPGGTFAYELTAGAGQTNYGLGASTSTGNAGFVAMNFPGTYTVKVTYTAPDGAVCEDTIEIVMQCS